MHNILKIFKNIAKPFMQKNHHMLPVFDDKAKAIKNELKDFDFNVAHNETSYLLYSKEPFEQIIQNDFFVYISHIDLIKKFNRDFLKGREPFEIDDKYITGALDNTLINAIVIDILKTEFVSIPNNALFLFTYGEEDVDEVDGGMEMFMKLLQSKGVIQNGSFYNMDITNYNWKQSISVEYDEPRTVAKQSFKLLKEQFDVAVQYERWPDDICEVLDYNGAGISICLPTKKEIHSWRNTTKLEKIISYRNFISYITKNPIDLRN